MKRLQEEEAAQLEPALRLAIYMADFHGGGVERMTMMLVEAFVARGVDVTIVVNGTTGELRSLAPQSVRLVSLEARRSILALPGLTGFLRREPPDVMMSSLGHSNIVALWARRLARLTSANARRHATRVVICQHNTLSVEATAMKGWHYTALPRLYRWFGSGADGIVGVSKGVSDDLAVSSKIAPSRITTIYNPVIDSRFEGALAQPSTHPWLTDRSLQVIVGLGRLVLQKDFATLITAFARLNRPDTRLLILGDGEEMENLQALAAKLGVADRVALPGFVLNPLPSLRDARVMVMSSIYEGLGNALVEGLAAGTAVVSTRCPHGPAEILENGRYGELVDVADAEAMAAAIARQLDDPRPAREERVARGRDFNIDAAADRYLALLRTAGRADVAESRPSSVMVYIPTLRMGGAELSMLRLAEGMAARGVPVTLVVNDAMQSGLKVPARVELVSLDTNRSLGAVHRLAALLRRRRPATLLSGFPHTNLVAVMARALARIDCKVVITEHAPLSRQICHMGGWRYRYMPVLARVAYPRADAVVAVSDGVAEDLQGIVPHLAPRMIYNPVLAYDWREHAAERVGHPWLEDSSVEVVLSASRLSTEKDIPTLLRAFVKVAATRPAARLVIAGDGLIRADLEREAATLGIAARVLFAGTIARPLAWMRRARVFVLPSRFEGFGNVLVEALAAGTQVISTDCPVGPREILEDGALGELIPVGDANAMADAIAAALERTDPAGDPAQLGATRAAAQVRSDKVALAYTQERACAAYLQLFADLRRPAAASGTGTV